MINYNLLIKIYTSLFDKNEKVMWKKVGADI